MLMIAAEHATTTPDTARRAGRPIRFLATVMLLWTGGRAMVTMEADTAILSWPGAAALAAFVDRIGPPQTASATTPAMASLSPARASPAERYHGRIERTALPAPSRQLIGIPIITTDAPPSARRAMLTIALPIPSDGSRMAESSATFAASLSSASSTAAISVPATGPSSPGAAAGRDGTPRRWSGSAWLLWRNSGSSRTIGSAGQLGGAQAGARIDRHLGRPVGSMPASAYARITTALREPAAPEAALGLALYPIAGRMPVMIGVERRIALDRNGRNAFALLAATGLNPTRVPGGLTAEGYAQMGMAGLSRRDLFADGRVSLTAPLEEKSGTGIGISLSGGAQPGLSRLDVGPVLQTRLPLGGVRPRLSVEWRHRIAGSARPDSGLAVTLAGDF